MLQDYQKSNFIKSPRGFTLVELLVVIAIIGILSAIGITSYNQSREKARDAQRKSALASIRTALLNYYDDNDFTYPDTTDGGGAPEGSASGMGIFDPNEANNVLVPEYLSILLEQPSENALYQYYYDANSALTAYILYTHLEGISSDWYWIDSTGDNGRQDDADTHVDANCELTDTCTW